MLVALPIPERPDPALIGSARLDSARFDPARLTPFGPDRIGGGAVYAVYAMAYTHFTQCMPGIALAYTLWQTHYFKVLTHKI